LGEDWMPKDITTGLFGTFETLMQALAKSLRNLLEQYDLTKKIITYVKDEGANLNTMTIALKLVVNCEAWGVMEIFQGTYFGDAFFKARQNAIVKEIISKGLIYVSIKSTQIYLQKSITWHQTLRKTRYEWMKACVIASLKLIKLNTLIQTK